MSKYVFLFLCNLKTIKYLHKPKVIYNKKASLINDVFSPNFFLSFDLSHFLVSSTNYCCFPSFYLCHQLSVYYSYFPQVSYKILTIYRLTPTKIHILKYLNCCWFICLLTALSTSILGFLFKTKSIACKFSAFSTSLETGAAFRFLDDAPGVIVAIPLASFSLGKEP